MANLAERERANRARILFPRTDGFGYVYELIDSRTREVKYVGQTVDPWGRLILHKNNWESSNKKKVAWLHELAMDKANLNMRVVGRYPQEELHDREAEHFLRCVFSGSPLVNSQMKITAELVKLVFDEYKEKPPGGNLGARDLLKGEQHCG